MTFEQAWSKVWKLLSGGGAVGVLFDNALGPTALHLPKIRLASEAASAITPPKPVPSIRAAADLLSWPGGRVVERVGQDHDLACYPAARASNGLIARSPFAPWSWR